MDILAYKGFQMLFIMDKELIKQQKLLFMTLFTSV